MRRVLKVVGILFVAVLACAVGLLAWLYFYTSDLPPVSQLAGFKGGSEPEAQFNPATDLSRPWLSYHGKGWGDIRLHH
jgi:hypothetical protein